MSKTTEEISDFANALTSSRRDGVRHAELNGGLAVAVWGKQAELLRELLADLLSPPRHPYVTLYSPKGAEKKFRISYRVKGYKRRTERLGENRRLATARAVEVSAVLQKVKAKQMKPMDAHRQLYVDRSPVETHLKTYERHLFSESKATKRYIQVTMYRIRELLRLSEIERIDEITLDRVSTGMLKLHESEDASGKKLSDKTAGEYLSRFRTFVRWLKRHGKIGVDPLADMRSVEIKDEEDRRRDAMPEEVALICAAAERDLSPLRKFKGSARSTLYAFAFATGLRTNECRQSQIDWLRLDADDPHIIVPKHITKTKTDATLQLPAWLVTALKEHLGDRKHGAIFDRMPGQMTPLFHFDLAAARTTWIDEAKSKKEREEREASHFLKLETVEGKLVFHSLRHGLASTLLSAGIDPKTVQSMTRHKTMKQLMDRYAHARRGGAIDASNRALPDVLADRATKKERG